jgi:hypothetical protein
MTHYPPLAGTDDHMADILRWTLKDTDIPPEVKDPATWPERMRREWSNDGGTAAARDHRAALRAGLQRCRQELDAFAPDVLVVWGDDQYENFREEVVPPFCALAYSDTTIQPFRGMAARGVPNAWGLPEHASFTLRGAPELARALTSKVLEAGFDLAYSYRPRTGAAFPHAIANTQLYLDYEHAGTQFPYPTIGITVNCYGQHVIGRRGGRARFADIAREQLDPPAPSPARCWSLGAAVAATLRDSPHRVALIASSSWSHAFLTDKNWHLHPDTAADQKLYSTLDDDNYEPWRYLSSDDVVTAGQQEILNWICLLGAMNELGHTTAWSNLVQTDLFNSNKCFAAFSRPTDGEQAQGIRA